MSNRASKILQFPVERRRWIRPPRMLRLVTHITNRSFEVCPGYIVDWWTQTLECGHRVKAYTLDDVVKVRRLCPECTSILRHQLSAPVTRITSLRKERHDTTRSA